MRVRNLQRFVDDFREYVDQHAAARVPVPTYGMVGLIVRKPYRASDLSKLNDLLDQVHRDELSLDIHETDSKVSVLAYTSSRRGMRQVS